MPKSASSACSCACSWNPPHAPATRPSADTPSATGGAATPETLAWRLGVPEEKFGTVLTALEALTEVGVIDYSRGTYLPTDSGKKNLADSKVLQRLN